MFKSVSRLLPLEMIRRRARAVGIETKVCNHTFRATGITRTDAIDLLRACLD